MRWSWQRSPRRRTGFKGDADYWPSWLKSVRHSKSWFKNSLVLSQLLRVKMAVHLAPRETRTNQRFPRNLGNTNDYPILAGDRATMTEPLARPPLGNPFRARAATAQGAGNYPPARGPARTTRESDCGTLGGRARFAPERPRGVAGIPSPWPPFVQPPTGRSSAAVRPWPPFGRGDALRVLDVEPAPRRATGVLTPAPLGKYRGRKGEVAAPALGQSRR
jgi:hypothetical protein